MSKKLAFISDIHGNILALQAVLEDIEEAEVDGIYCLGDLVGYGTRPNEVIELIREREIPTIMGNYDDGVGNDREDCGCAYPDPEEARLGDLSLEWTKKEVTPENRRFLAELPKTREVEAGSYRFKLVHGSPRRINEYLYIDRPAKSLNRFFQDEDFEVLVCGHTHLPYVRLLEGGIIINDGTAGKPKRFGSGEQDYSPAVSYALVRAAGAGGGERGGEVAGGESVGEVKGDAGPAREISVELRTVKYDQDKAAREIEASGLPDHFAEILRGRA